jgi:chromosome segregation protein
MYLKSLQLVGFKSFAEKTSLDFIPGVTAIVGPNGCGKSNVADAIRWVLGEQSAKALRGSEMADVIFSGTDGRKAIGMAEVSMTFADVDATTISLPGVNLDFNEVTITRRVYRDGAGEYLINKTPCRLRDIQNMFMDTGIGRSSYSLMAQGQIDQILSVHPEDRRNIFEEAAGINKYKHQKKEALRKLEFTEQNLVRLTDIIKEVKRQIISLQRQAGKARRYKELFDQLKVLDTKLSRHRFDLLHADITGLEAAIAAIAAQSEQFASEITASESQIEQLRRSLGEIERAIGDTTSRDHDLRNETDRHQQRITTNTERVAESEQAIERHRREIAGSEEKIHIQEQELARLNSEYDQIDFLLAAEQGKLRAQQDDLKALDNEINQKNRALNEAKIALVDIERQIAGGNNELGALDLRGRNDKLRAERLCTERLQLEDQRATKHQQLENFHTGLTELRAALEPLRASLAERETALAALATQLRVATEQHNASVAELSSKSARLDLLRKLFAAPDGHNTLGHVIEVEPQYGAAVEAALAASLRTVLANDVAAARALLSGNAVTAPELAGTLTEHDGTSGNVPLGAMAWAANVTRVRDERFAPLVRSLLANVAIAGDLDLALNLRGYHPHLSFATLRGEFVNAHGILSAVSTSHIAEISALTDETVALQARVAELATAQFNLESQKTALERDFAALRAELHANEVALAGKEGELNSLTTDQRDLDSKIHTVIFEVQAIEQQDAEDKSRRDRILGAIRDAEARQGALREQMAEAQAIVDELLRHREEMNNQLTEFRVSVGGLEHKRGSIEANREPIAGRIRDFRERMQTCAADIETGAARIAQFRAENAESEQKITELVALREQLQQQIAALQNQRNEVATGVSQAEAELKALRQKAYEAQQQKSGYDVQVAQKRMEVTQLKDRVWQKYQVNVEEVSPDAITITVADSGPVITEQVSRETDWDAVEAQVAEMQTKLEAMGTINLDAIQEYDELEERYKFLTQQHEDLIKAKEQLLQVIAKINTTTKQLFSETFEKVRANFQQIFTELFGGGKANLILLDENDPLESGIEIVAKPPGKQLQSITLLSGGEKTLTATALLFSIYMVKPSPFCVLDELDAPLDESNINRFIRILQRFITLSQFVIITHNKRTIGMADALYGITMEEHGVSKVVSVKFSPREEKARKLVEHNREIQEERIDAMEVIAAGPKPHEEELRNDLLIQKEATVAPVSEAAAPVVAETAPVLGQAAPDEVKAEVQAAVAEAVALNETVKETVAETQPEQNADSK